MSTYYVKGTGAKVTLTDREFIAKGGEKSVYALGSMAYCVYHDPAAAIPADKIQELSVLDKPEIIKPLSELLDSRKRHCGETMPFVTDSWAPQDTSIKPLVLCQLFTNAFRRKQGITNDHIVKISDSIVSVVRHCHEKGVLLVDPNETNWLVHHSLSSIFLIDTSCCQTAHYPGTAIKPAIRDWSVNRFSQDSDWFSVAVVLGWLWAGIHPYLAHHPDWDHMDANTALEPRMRKHASFFDAKTQFNRACRPLADIPAALCGWLKAVLHDGQRIPAPLSCLAAATLSPSLPVRHIVEPHDAIDIIVTEIERYAKDIVSVFEGIAVFEAGLVIGKTPVKGQAVRANVKAGMLNLSVADVTSRAKSVLESDGRIYAVSSTAVSEVLFNEMAHKTTATVRHVGSLADLSTTKTWPGCVVQNMLGRYLLSTFPATGKCVQHFLPELDSWQILDCRYQRGVFIAMAERSGNYRLVRYRFSECSSDCTDLSHEFGDVNFTVNDRGVCVILLASGELVACSAKPGVTSERRFAFPQTDMLLFSKGAQILGAYGKVLYNLAIGKK